MRIYLHIFDPQIVRLVRGGAQLADDDYFRLLRFMFLGCPNTFVCASAHVFESDFLRRFVFGPGAALVQAGDIVWAQAQSELRELVDAKRAQYGHVRKLPIYSTYWRQSIVDEIADSGLHLSAGQRDSGLALERHLVRSLDNEQDGRQLRELHARTAETILARGHRAITLDLFPTALRTALLNRSGYDMALRISISYTSQQLKKNGATIFCNVPYGFSRIDEVATSRIDWQRTFEFYRASGLFNAAMCLSWSEIAVVRRAPAFRALVYGIQDSLGGGLLRANQFLEDASRVCLGSRRLQRMLAAQSGGASNFIEIAGTAHAELVREGSFEQQRGSAIGSSKRREANMKVNSRKPRSVFLVHGRDHEARARVSRFLRALNLEVIEFESAVASTGHGSPYVGDAVRQGLATAQAVLVLFTGDDEVKLRDELLGPGEHPEPVAHQPRPNVIFEAGLAMGMDEARTILVEVGRLRAISDLSGRHVIRWDGSTESRNRLRGRLQVAGCEVDSSGSDWLTV